MNDTASSAPMPAKTASDNQSPERADDVISLDRQMAQLGLSSDTQRFLRHLHIAEKQLNDAFCKARQGGALESCVSQVYHDLYGADCASAGARSR